MSLFVSSLLSKFFVLWFLSWFWCFILNNLLWVSTYDNYFSMSGLPNSKECFSLSSISVQSSRYHYLFIYLFILCVYVPHFPYQFFSQGEFRLFPGSGFDKQWHYEHSWAQKLVAWLITLWIYTQKRYSWVLRKLVSLFLEIITLISKGAVPACTPTINAELLSFPNNLSSIRCHQCFWSWSFYRCKMESESCFDLHFSDD